MSITDEDLTIEYMFNISSSKFVIILYYILQIDATVRVIIRVVAS
jgi:hypothetical protein